MIVSDHNQHSVNGTSRSGRNGGSIRIPIMQNFEHVGDDDNEYRRIASDDDEDYLTSRSQESSGLTAFQQKIGMGLSKLSDMSIDQQKKQVNGHTSQPETPRRQSTYRDNGNIHSTYCVNGTISGTNFTSNNNQYTMKRNDNKGSTSSLLSRSLGTAYGFAFQNRLPSTTSMKSDDDNNNSTNNMSPSIMINHRNLSDISSINYSGYLLKRSNKPYLLHENLNGNHRKEQLPLSIESSAFFPFPTDEDTNNDINEHDGNKSHRETFDYDHDNNYGNDGDCFVQTPTTSHNKHFTPYENYEQSLFMNGKKPPLTTVFTSTLPSSTSVPTTMVPTLAEKEPITNHSLASAPKDATIQFVAKMFDLVSELLPPPNPQLEAKSEHWSVDNLSVAKSVDTISSAIQQFAANKQSGVSTSFDRSCNSETQYRLDPPVPKRIPFNYDTTIRSVSAQVSSLISAQQPSDFIDPNDGHIWRSKYCVLDGECLFFYSHEVVAHSHEAEMERRRWKWEEEQGSTSIYHVDNHDEQQQPKQQPQYMCQQQAHVPIHQHQPQAHLTRKKSQKSMLSQSPMPRHSMLHLNLVDDSGSSNKSYDQLPHPISLNNCHQLFEKVVALECVGAVRSAELEFGPNSFELSATGNKKRADGAIDLEEEDDDDKLVLRAQNKDEMNEWLFQFHRSIATFVRDIMNQIMITLPHPSSPTSTGSHTLRQRTIQHRPRLEAFEPPMLPLAPSRHASKPMNISPTTSNDHPSSTLSPASVSGSVTSTDGEQRKINNSIVDSSTTLTPGEEYHTHSVATYSPRFHKIMLYGGSGSASSSTPFSLSHGHGRNSIHRRRGGSFSACKDNSHAISDLGAVAGSPMIPLPTMTRTTMSHEIDKDKIIKDSGDTRAEQSTDSILPSIVHFPQRYGQDGGSDITPAAVTPTPRMYNRIDAESLPTSFGSPTPSQITTITVETSKNQLQHVTPTEKDSSVPLPKSTVGKYVPPHLRNKQQGPTSTTDNIPTSFAGSKYVPPHLRTNNAAGASAQMTSLSAKNIPDPLHFSNQKEMSLSDPGYVPRYVRASTNNTNSSITFVDDNTVPFIIPQSEGKDYMASHRDSVGIGDNNITKATCTDDDDSDVVIKVGGCADPLHAQGSILDKRYIQSTSSKLKKVRAVPHGHISDHKTIHRHNGNNHPKNEPTNTTTSGQSKKQVYDSNVWTSRLRWEIGAVSECGIRDTNQDSYLVTSNLLEVFAQTASATCTTTQPDPKLSSSSSSSSSTSSARNNTVWDQDSTLHPPGLFAIFDGHCGDHASRFAAELLTKFIQTASLELGKKEKDEVSKYANNTPQTQKSVDTVQIERILDKAIREMDDAFCKLCVEDERAWYSGSTALVAALFNESLIIANLGDSRGVMGRSVLANDANEYIKQGWNQLPTEENHDSNKKYLWKSVTTLHSPGQEDEQQRIRKANGWVTTEKEIPVSQLQRMALYDDDVIDILKRCFAEHYTNANNNNFDNSNNNTSPPKTPATKKKNDEKNSQCFSPSPVTTKASAPQRIIEISRVCGELAVSRALGDRDFKSAFQEKMSVKSSSSATTNKSDSTAVAGSNHINNNKKISTSIHHQPNDDNTNDTHPNTNYTQSTSDIADGSSSTDAIVWKSSMCLPYPPNHNGIFIGDLVSNAPEFHTIVLGERNVFDEFLLLACDGLFDVMDPDDAYRVAHGLLFDKKWPAKKAAARLAELAIHLGSSDNITVIVVRFFHDD